MKIPIASFEIRFDQDIVHTRQHAYLIAELLGFSRKDQVSISTAISEISRNCFQYAHEGVAEFSIVGTMPDQWLSMIVRDNGPGIAMLADILDGQFNSFTGLGKGIIGSRRLLPDHFQIETSPEQGTIVTLGKSLPTMIQPVSNKVLASISEALAAQVAESPLEQVRKQSEAALQETHAQQQTVLEGMPDGYLRINGLGVVLEANTTYLKQSGYTRDELLGMRISDLETNSQSSYTLRRIDKIVETGADHFEVQHRRKDTSVWYVDISINYLEMLGGQYFVFLRDITQRKEHERELSIAAIAFEAHEGIFITDAQQIILKVNQAFTSITGYSAEEVIGKTPRILSSGQHDQRFYSLMWESLNSTGSWDGEVWNKCKTGELFAEHLTITAVKDADNTLTNYVATFSDITLSKNAAEEIQKLAFYDPLTQLPNRRLLLNRLSHAIATSARNGNIGALLFIDLDNFKMLNDTCGHNSGDLLLQQVAERLTSCCRESDTAARLGGDEFVVMLEGLSQHREIAASQAKIVGNKILETLNQSYDLCDHIYHNTPSIGVTLFCNHESNIEDLLMQADIAMYQAKNAGRNALRFFDPKMQEQVNSRVALESELRKALTSDQFRLYYQLQVDYQNRPIGAEVLIRWIHPEKGIISPMEFIPLAEEIGLIIPIGRWVLEIACAQLKAWQHQPATQGLALSVNVSPKQFHQPDFIDVICGLVKKYEISPMLLKLELTESMLLENIEDTIQTISRLKSIGIGFSLDDFGTGYSSLQYLKRLPLDQLKIDQSFVRDLLLGQNDTAIVLTIIALGQSMGLEVIAEGVETEAQRDFLAMHGCYRYQGYFFSKPLPLDDFERFVDLYSGRDLASNTGKIQFGG